MDSLFTEILTNIRNLTSRVTALETSPQPPNIELSNDATASFSLAAAGSAGDVAWAEITLTETNAQRLMGNNVVSLFIGSVAANNHFPEGSNITADMTRNTIVSGWLDWELTDNNNLKEVFMIINKSASSRPTCNIAANWRFLQAGGTVS